MLAALMGHPPLIPILLEAGADPSLRDGHGLTALEWAQRRGFQRIIELLGGAPESTHESTTRAEDEQPYRLGPQELGPATMAVLKTVHASLEAQRQRAGTAAQMAPEPQSAQQQIGDITLAEYRKPESNGENERERLFAAGFKKLEALTQGKAVSTEQPQTPRGNELPQVPAAAPVESESPQQAAASSSLESESPQQVGASSFVESELPPRIRTTASPGATAPLTPSIHTTPLVDPRQTMTQGSADPLLSTREFVTAPLVSPPSPILGNDDLVRPKMDDAAWSSPMLEPDVEERDEPTVVAAQPVTPPAPDPVMQPAPALPPAPAALVPETPTPQPAAKSSFLHSSILETQARPTAGSQSIVKPVLWVLVIFALLGSVYLTYTLTNRFIHRQTATTTPTTTSTSSTTPGTVAKSPSKFPLTAGALENAESSLPDAEYPASAKADGISGIVTVVTRVNKAHGVVIAAHALNGDFQLRTAAEKAAKQAKFAPEKLHEDSKVVTGTITYRFGNATVANSSTADADSPVLGGALAGTGLNVPKAEYPTGANVQGGVVLVVARVNRFGDVIAAQALNGDQQLRSAAVKAARKARFAKEKLPTETQVTSGTIAYDFRAPQISAPAATTAPTPNAATPPGTPPVGDTPVVGGDLAGKEKNIPKAEYPAGARSRKVTGTVTILVRVNKAGQVISWRTLSGDSLLKGAALAAAKKATFDPQKLGDMDTILGTITYNFQP
jgi:TonB family protein